MPPPIITVDRLSKRYRLGQFGMGPLRDRLAVWGRRGKQWLRGRPGPEPPLRGAPFMQAGPPELWALRDVSFEVAPGEVLGIIGRNGAGKSTLLKILSRITEPTAGRAIVQGRLASLLEVGTGFHPELTGRENIFLNGTMLGMRKAEIARKLDEIVAFSEIERFMDTPVKHYSSGMYVRLAFAVAAHLDPEILVIDEVLAVGDAEFRKKCLGKMHEVAGQGRTILFVSHDLRAIAQMCARVLLIDSGRLVLEGPPRTCIDRYMGVALANPSVWNRTKVPDESCPASLVRVHVSVDGTTPATCIRSNDAVSVVALVEVHRESKEMDVSANLSTDSGVVLFATGLRESAGQVVFKPGMYEVTLRFPDQMLLPRTYALHVGLWSEMCGAIDCMECLQFTVEDAYDYGGVDGRRLGHLVVPCHWKLRSVTP